ncbi:MAG: hypothetical protein ACKVRO_08655 [Micropepsaceae bacterium]
MTLSTTAARVSHGGNGTTVTFPFAFKIWAPANLKVYVRNNATLADTLQTLNADYTIDIVTYPATGNVVFAFAPPAAHTVVILRDMPLTQELDLIASGTFAAENVEQQLDKLTAEIQTLRELIARTPRLPVGTALADPALPEPRSANNNQLLAINATGDGFDLKVPVNLSLQTVSSFIGTLLDDADAATARATLGVGNAVDLNLLTTDATGGAVADFVPFVDASDGNASKKVRVPILLSTAIATSNDTTPALGTDYEMLARKLSDGTLHRPLLSEVGIGKQTLWIPAGAMTPRATNGPAPGSVETPTNKVMIKTLDFDAATAEFAQAAVQMPKGWNEGTLSGVIVWSHGTATVNYNVVWAIQGRAFSDNDPLDAAFGSAVTVTDSGGTADQLYRTGETPAFTLSGSPAESDVAIFQLQRAATDAADTLAADARLHGVALFYTTNANTDD